MKKIAFALQVFSLMMLLPVYVIIEMNHATVGPTGKDMIASAIGKVKMVSADQYQTKNYKIKI